MLKDCRPDDVQRARDQAEIELNKETFNEQVVTEKAKIIRERNKKPKGFFRRLFALDTKIIYEPLPETIEVQVTELDGTSICRYMWTPTHHKHNIKLDIYDGPVFMGNKNITIDIRRPREE